MVKLMSDRMLLSGIRRPGGGESLRLALFFLRYQNELRDRTEDLKLKLSAVESLD